MSRRRAARRASKHAPGLAPQDCADVSSGRRPAFGGRRKAVRKPCGLPISAALGGAALILAAVGAVALSQPLPQASAQPLSGGASTGTPWVGTTSSEPHDSLYSRTDPRVSRASGRAPLVQSGAQESAAEARADARSAQLRSAAIQAKSYARDVALQGWTLPTTRFHISTWFGEGGWYWSGGYHTGIDFATACGTPIVAVTGGTVTQAGWDGPYGYQVRERLPNGDEVWYNHLAVVKTNGSADLRKGGVVGLVGETGNAYGCHLHLEYRLASDLETGVDPAPFFASHGITLH